MTRPDAKAKPAPDLIGRDFRAERPGTKLVGDITYLPTAEGWLYLACWLDLATREVIGYAMADHHRAELVVDALDMAHGRGGLESGCIVHSDRGSEYTSTQFRERIGKLGLRQSCGRTGSCFDNAAAESFWALLKEEIGTRTCPTGPPPAPRSSPSLRPSTTAAACASTGLSATSPRPRPGSSSTPSRHNHYVSEITEKLHLGPPMAGPRHPLWQGPRQLPSRPRTPRGASLDPQPPEALNDHNIRQALVVQDLPDDYLERGLADKFVES
ncbi:IS3 family transposase [Streptomyces sp. WG7]|uniref:IS3 family transposase n=1 Tax=Streptomyces sp. WG7 TaxID=3417650 RepID=UPI003CF9A01E